MISKEEAIQELKNHGVVEHIPFDKLYDIIVLHARYYQAAAFLHVRAMAEIVVEARNKTKKMGFTSEDLDIQFKNMYDKLGSADKSLDTDAFLTAIRWE